MNIFDYLDKESPEINHALAHGFRKGDSNAVGRTLLEEIKARKTLVRQLADRMKTVEAVDRQAVDTSGLQASVNQQQELINLQQELIEQQQEESSNQQLKIGELEQDVADANTRIDELISGLTVLLQQLAQTSTADS
jgi:soluble cytochrome b562